MKAIGKHTEPARGRSCIAVQFDGKEQLPSQPLFIWIGGRLLRFVQQVVGGINDIGAIDGVQPDGSPSMDPGIVVEYPARLDEAQSANRIKGRRTAAF